jgi:hypothetical protein
LERLLLFIKHHLGFIWNIIDRINGIFFLLIYGKRLDRVLPDVFAEADSKGLVYRKLYSDDIHPLHDLIAAQQPEDLAYFNPHSFTIEALRRQVQKPAFLMMGVFDGEKLAGYFFLRFFVNKKCFVGRLIEREYRGKGFGSVMNFIMYETAWRMGFRCLSTISRNNTAVMKAHSRNPNIVVLKELSNDYLLVEFVRKN